MIKRTPITSKPRTSNRLIRYTLECSDHQLNKIRGNVYQHMGDYALFYREEKRDMLPVLVELVRFSTYFVTVRYKVYDPVGIFRQYLYTSIQYSSLYCGDSRLVFFEDDI